MCFWKVALYWDTVSYVGPPLFLNWAYELYNISQKTDIDISESKHKDWIQSVNEQDQMVCWLEKTYNSASCKNEKQLWKSNETDIKLKLNCMKHKTSLLMLQNHTRLMKMKIINENETTLKLN